MPRLHARSQGTPFARTLRTLSPLVVLGCGGLAHAQCANFAPEVTYATTTLTRCVATGDVNGDGKLDLVTSAQSASICTLLGNGDGTFQPAVITALFGQHGYWVAIADLNSDGKLDLAVAKANANNVGIMIGNGNGTFQPIINYACGPSPVHIGVGDFNGDGRPDLAVANEVVTLGAVNILLGTGGGAFGAPTNIPLGNFASRLVIGDYNADGKLDIAAANSTSGGRASVLIGVGNGTFAAPVHYPATNAYSIAAADFDVDGELDLSVGSGSGGGLSALAGNGNGTFQPQVIAPYGNIAYSTVAHDFSLDGKPDVVMTYSGTNFIGYFKGLGNGSFAPPIVYPTATTPQCLAVGDFNADGRPDLAVAHFNAANVGVFLQVAGASPVITLQPSCQSVIENSSASFSVTATDATTFQWRRNGVPLVNGGNISGATSASLSVSPATLADGCAAFDCVVSNACGSVTSNPTALCVAPQCGTADFDGDGDPGTDADIEAFFVVLGGGSC
jgi:hypothetical protein